MESTRAARTRGRDRARHHYYLGMEERRMKATYAVEIDTPESGRTVSRFFTTLAAARKWAAWTAKRWPSRILRGGIGGEEVQ